MRCSRCGIENPIGKKFCGDCGAPLVIPTAAVSVKKPDDRQIRVADACLRAGRIDHGLKAIDDALDLVRRGGECFWEAEINRLRGELLLGQSPSNSALAEGAFEHAVELARQQRAKSLELRATTSLARMLNRALSLQTYSGSLPSREGVRG